MSEYPYLRTDVYDDILIIELRDRKGSVPDHSISKEFDEIRRRRRDVGFTKVVFDLGKAPFFGSTLLEQMRILWNDLVIADGKLVLCNPSAFGREIIEVAKFDQLWPVVDNRTRAFELLSSGQNVAAWPDSLQKLISAYDNGPGQLQSALSGLSPMQARTPAPPGGWSTLQVVCHIADFEIVYADRLKRVLAEDQPILFGGDPDQFAARLAYSQRNLDEEVALITAVRRQTSRLLKTLIASDFERIGKHSTDGPLTLTQLLSRIAGHIPHHVQFIEGKKASLLK